MMVAESIVLYEALASRDADSCILTELVIDSSRSLAKRMGESQFAKHRDVAVVKRIVHGRDNFCSSP